MAGQGQTGEGVTALQLQEMLRGMKDELMAKMDNVATDIRTDIQALGSRVSTVEATVSEHTKALDFQNGEIDKLKNVTIPGRCEEILDRVLSLEEHVLYNEIHDRKTNLRFYGIPVETTQENTEETARLFMKDCLKIDGQKVDGMVFVDCHRLPRYPLVLSSQTDTPPPAIIVAFTTMTDRNLALDSARNLKGTRKTVRTDLPPQLMVIRSKMSTKAFELRTTLKCQTRIRERRTELLLETRESTSAPWIVHSTSKNKDYQWVAQDRRR